jgi:glucose/arabinose dehydrogenase
VPRLLVAALFVIGTAGVACGKPAPQPPTVTPPSGSQPILGTERLGWDQRAGDNAELATIRYAIYVDGARSELTGVACADAATDAGYTCSAPLPRMSLGNHSLELASFVQDGGVLESPRSATLRVTVAAGTPTSGNPNGSSVTAARAAAAIWPAAAIQVASGLNMASDLAIVGDGRVLVAERSGTIRVLRNGALVPAPALVLPNDVKGGESVLALAIDPQFARTRFVFAIYTSRNASGVLAFTLARFREAGDTLADRVVLLDGIRASAEPHAALRFGPDGKLYAGFDDGGDAERAADPASLNGKILRLNPDGTTPDDQPRGTPVLVSGLTSPRGIEWHRPSNRMWTADVARVGSVRWVTPPASLAARGDDLVVASEAGVQRSRVDRRNPDRIAETSDLLKGLAIAAVAVAPDGTIYFATPTAIGRIP